MAMNLNDENVNERKLNTIKLRILEVETDNIVKKESKAAMIDKIYKLIMQEVDKKGLFTSLKCTISDSISTCRKCLFLQIQRGM